MRDFGRRVAVRIAYRGSVSLLQGFRAVLGVRVYCFCSFFKLGCRHLGFREQFLVETAGKHDHKAFALRAGYWQCPVSASAAADAPGQLSTLNLNVGISY